MTAPDFTRFTVTVDHLTDGYLVKVDADDSSEIYAGDVEVALRMSVPFMAAVASPMQGFAAALREMGVTK